MVLGGFCISFGFILANPGNLSAFYAILTGRIFQGIGTGLVFVVTAANSIFY